MIMGMIDVLINNNQHASMDDNIDDRVHGAWAMLQVREQSLFERVERTQPCKQWSNEAAAVAPIYIRHGV